MAWMVRRLLKTITIEDIAWKICKSQAWIRKLLKDFPDDSKPDPDGLPELPQTD
jgi:hypothetical protein